MNDPSGTPSSTHTVQHAPGAADGRPVAGRSRTSGRPTIKMVAERAMVSTATVSYVLSGRGGRKSGVAAEATARVHAAASELGYRRNEAARSIRTGVTGFAVLALTMLSDSWSLDMVDAASEELHKYCITPLILGDADWRSFVGKYDADVVFIDDIPLDNPQFETDVALLTSLSKQGQKLVVMSNHITPKGFDVVRSHTFPGCDEAMQLLLSHHARVGCVSTKMAQENFGSRTRYGAYVTQLEAAGFPFEPNLVEFCERDSLSAFASATKLLRQENPPTAIFATSDYIAEACIQAAQSLQLRVPEDLAVVGIGNTAHGAKASPSLTSVGPHHFFERLSQHLARRARESSVGPGELIEFTWEVFPRESTLSPTIGSSL